MMAVDERLVRGQSTADPVRHDELHAEAKRKGRKERQSDLLDEALLETFPASDPVSVSRVR